MEKPFYSLREAACLTGVPEEDLRRSILMGELVAEPVADDRQYLISSSDLVPLCGKNPSVSSRTQPSRRERLFCLCAFAVVAVLSIGPLLFVLWAGAVQQVDYFCADCTRTLHTLRLGQTVVLSHRIEVGPFSEFVDRADPAPCRHEWISFWAGRTGWQRLESLKEGALLKTRSNLSENDKVELIRWILRQKSTARPVPGERTAEPRFQSVEQFRQWCRPAFDSE